MRTIKSLFLAGSLLTFLRNLPALPKNPLLRKADLAAANTLRERALADATAYQLVESLTTEVGARLAGSPGDKAAVALGACAKCSAWDSQTCAAAEVIVPHWVRGEAEFAVLAPWPQAMPTLALGGSVGTGRRRHRGRSRHGQGPRGPDRTAGRRREGQDRLLQQSHGTHARRLRLRARRGGARQRGRRRRRRSARAAW